MSLTADYTRKAPPEILTEIFKCLHALSTPSSSSVLVNASRLCKLYWPVSQVCRYWREVALAAPFLWTTLPVVVLDGHSLLSPQDRLECVKTLVPRCRGQPLRISFTCSRNEFWPLQSVPEYLVKYADHWRCIDVCVSNWMVNVILGDHSFPRLEEARIKFDDSRCAHRHIRALRDSSLLKTLRVSGTGGNWTLWVNTRSLRSLYDGTGTMMREIRPTGTCADYSMLTSLELHDRGLVDYGALASDVDTLAKFKFPALKTVAYYCYDRVYPEDGFLQYAVTPALEDLTLESPQGDVFRLLKDLHGRSGSFPLKSLRLKFEEEDCAQDFLDLLVLFTDLEILEMDLMYSQDLSCLALSKDATVLAPNLKRCSFRYYGHELDDIHSCLANIASTRCEPSTCASARVSLETPTKLMDLGLAVEVYTHINWRMALGYRVDQNLHPTRLEPWYWARYPDRHWDDYRLPRNAYTIAVSAIPDCFDDIDKDSSAYKHSIELLTEVEQKYREPDQLVPFLETNTNLCMIAFAHALKTILPEDSAKEGSPYTRALHLLKTVKADLTAKLDVFHWIWEASTRQRRIRYIHEGHEMRADPDKFANAVLGLSDEQWLLNDF